MFFIRKPTDLLQSEQRWPVWPEVADTDLDPAVRVVMRGKVEALPQSSKSGQNG